MIVSRPYLASSVKSLPAAMQDAVRVICHSRCAEANRMGRAAHGPSWGRDIDPCVNDGEVCQGCIVRAAEMDA